MDSFAVLDVRAVHELHGGGRLETVWDASEGALMVTLDGQACTQVVPGRTAELGGFVLECQLGVRQRPTPMPVLIDSRWLQTLLIAGCVQVCVVSALWLTPAALEDPEPGAGLTMAQVERFLAVPAGGARKEGRATFAPAGERPDEAERVSHERPPLLVAQRDVPTFTWRSSPTALANALDSLLGDVDGTSDLARTLGDEALATARSEQSSAGVGGLLSPRALVEPGAGNGTVGIGSSRARELFERNERRLERDTVRTASLPRQEREVPRAEPALFPVTRAEVPEGSVSFEDIDPVVKDFLAQSVRRHRNSIRYCYERFGLTADPKRSGRLVLELTLQPDGFVRDVDATVDGAGLEAVARCVEEQASRWFLGAALSDGPRRLRFPFRLCPKRPSDAPVGDECVERWPSAKAVQTTTLSARQ